MKNNNRPQAKNSGQRPGARAQGQNAQNNRPGFNNKKRDRRSGDRRIYSPVNGTAIDLADVSDPVYAARLYGDGLAFLPADDVVCAPCAANVVLITNSRQAIGLETEGGDQILLHLGFNAVPNTRAMDILVNEGTRVKPGTPLVRINRKLCESQNIDTTIALVVTNPVSGPVSILEADTVQAGRTPVMERKG